MKDSRFTELISLYIDRQITAAEAAELETEIRDNADRRRTYVEYCKLHRASKLAYDNFRSHAEPGQAAPSGYAAIESFEQRQRGRRFRWLYAVGGAAAAVACLSVVSMRYAASNETAEMPFVPTAAVSAAAMTVAGRLPPMGRSDAGQPSQQVDNLLNLHNTFALELDLQSWLTALQAGQRNLPPETIGQPARLEPLFADKFFSGSDLLHRSQPRTYNSTQNTAVPQAPREFTAFQFQR